MAERPEDLNLPNAVVTRIIKDAIPDGVNVSKEARLAISKAASVFVLYATSCSNNFALKGKRKTINAQDVLSAMEDMEFEQFIEPLQQCQEAFRQEKVDKKKEKVIKPAAPVLQDTAEDDDDEVQEIEENAERVQNNEDDQDGDFVVTENKDTEEDGGSDSGSSSVEMVEDGGE